MAELIDFVRSQKYLRAYTMQQTGVASGILLVESPSDRLFWESLINQVCPGRYIVKHFSEGKAEGKRALESEYEHLHIDRIVGVDGDFDYICPDRSEKAIALNNNNLVLHTFCYSRESLTASYESISDIKNRTFYRNKIDEYIIDAINNYSKAIFDSLCIFSFLHNNNPTVVLENDFRHAISLIDNEKLLDDNFNVNMETINKLKVRNEQYISTLQQYINDETLFYEHKKNLNKKDINADNAYMFISGHYLQDSIVIPMLKFLASKSKAKDIEEIKEKYEATQKRSKIEEINNHYRDRCNIHSLIYQCQGFMNNSFWKKMADQLSAIS